MVDRRHILQMDGEFLFQLQRACADFFKLMNEVENEDLVFTLETVVEKFGEEMAPYALGLCQNLVSVHTP